MLLRGVLPGRDYAKTKKGALFHGGRVCPDGRLYYALTPCGAPLNPSVIRGCKIYGFIISRGEKSVKKSDNQLLPHFETFPWLS